MYTKYLNPKNDFAFKRVFGTEKNKDIVIHFLNDVIDFKEQYPIVDVTFLSPVQDPQVRFQKTSIVDVLCKDTQENAYIVQMQVVQSVHSLQYVKRAQFYAAKAYDTKMYGALKEVIFLAITDFVMFPEKESFKSDHVILDRVTLENDLKGFSFSFLELPKFNKSLEELSSVVDRWMYFFKHATEASPNNLKNFVGGENVFQRVFDELELFGLSEAELNIYEQIAKQDLDNRAVEEQKLLDREEKGRKEGRKALLVELVQKMQAQGMTYEQIANLVNLSVEELKRL